MWYDPAVMERTVRAALPRLLPGAGRSGALLIHGFASYPGIMDYLAGRLNDAGMTVSVPRLPGCGTSGRDFASVTAKEWYRRVHDSYQDLRAMCDRVCVAGLSLGALLTIRLAAEMRPDGIALLAPPIRNTNRLILLAPLLRPFVARIPGSYEIQGQDTSDPDVRYLAEEYWSWRWTGPAAEILKLQRQATSVLRRVRAPTLLVVSRADRTVPTAVADIIRKRIGAEALDAVVLDESRHTLVADTERERVADLVVDRFLTYSTRPENHSEAEDSPAI